MEQQYGQMPPGAGESPFKRFWHVWGPLIIKWGLGVLVSMLAMTALCFAYAVNNEAAMMAAMENEEQMTGIYNDIYKQYLHFSTLIEGIAALFTIPVMIFLFHRDRVKEKMRGAMPVKKAPILQYAAVIIMSLALSMGLNNLMIIGNLSAYSDSYTDTMNVLYSASLPVQLIALGILVPVCEELVFRGLIYKRLRESSAFVPAMLYSAFIFGLLHANMIQMIYSFLLGMVLAWMYEKYGSVLAPIVAHMVMNILSVLTTEYKLYDWLATDILYIGGATVACAAIAACMYVWMQRVEPGTGDRTDHINENSGYMNNRQNPFE